MEIVRSPAYSCCIFLGLQRNYSKVLNTKESVYTYIQAYQRDLIRTKSIYLSAAITEMDIVLSGQIEPHLQIRFINYPRFPLSKEVLEKSIIELAKKLMLEFDQNRVVVESTNEVIMIQQSQKVDPRIK